MLFIYGCIASEHEKIGGRVGSSQESSKPMFEQAEFQLCVKHSDKDMGPENRRVRTINVYMTLPCVHLQM